MNWKSAIRLLRCPDCSGSRCVRGWTKPGGGQQRLADGVAGVVLPSDPAERCRTPYRRLSCTRAARPSPLTHKVGQKRSSLSHRGNPGCVDCHRPRPSPAPGDVTGDLAFLTRALKAPTLRAAVDRLAERRRRTYQGAGQNRWPTNHAYWEPSATSQVQLNPTPQIRERCLIRPSRRPALHCSCGAPSHQALWALADRRISHCFRLVSSKSAAAVIFAGHQARSISYLRRLRQFQQRNAVLGQF